MGKVVVTLLGVWGLAVCLAIVLDVFASKTDEVFREKARYVSIEGSLFEAKKIEEKDGCVSGDREVNGESVHFRWCGDYMITEVER